MGHDQDCRPTAGASSAPGATAQTAPGPRGFHINGSTQVAGKINNGDAANLLHAGLPDATERKSAQLDLQVSQLLEAMKEPVIVHDSGVIIGFNQRVPDLLGCPPENLLWRRLSKFISPISLPTLTRWIRASDDYTILVNGVRTGGGIFVLRLETIASLVCPGGRRLAVVSLAEFGPNGRSTESSDSA
jgi:PAS domain-containing protein